LSKLIPLDKGEKGGGNLNEIVGSIPVIKISDLDLNYTHIKVYAIKYTSYNEVPSISLITEEFIPSNGEINIFDDGGVISTLSLEEFLFLGSDIIIPQHINSKFNRLFFANYEELNFEVKLDTRAYSFPSVGNCLVFSNSKLFEVGDTTPNINGITGEPLQITAPTFTNIYNDVFDSINLDYDSNKYQSNLVTHGGEGLYLKYELVQNNTYNSQHQYFKDEEIYRLAVQFYNKYGQVSLPNWVADFKSREGNLEKNYNKLKVTLKPEFYNWINNSSNFNSDYEKPIGYKVLIAKRDVNDRTIVANGIIGTMLCNDSSGTENVTTPYVQSNSQKLPKLPNILLRNCDDNFANAYGTSKPLKNSRNLDSFYQSSSGENPQDEAQFAFFVDQDTSGRSWQFNSLMQLYSPELVFKTTNNLTNNLKFKVKGALKNSYNASWIKESHVDGSETSECKVYDGISPQTTGGPTRTVKTITGRASNCLSAGLIGHPTGSDPNHYERMLFYRNYGDLSTITDTYTAGGSVIKFVNPFICPTTDANIDFQSLNKIISVKLGKTNPAAIVTGTYSTTIVVTVTPTSLTDVYDFRLCSDINGVNTIGTPLYGVTGIQTITLTTGFVPSPSGSNYRYVNTGVVVESAAPFTATVDANVKVYHIDPLSVLTDECDTTLNPVSTGPTSIPSGIYYKPSVNKIYYNTYGAPEVTEVNQTFKSYNNDNKLRYTNTLKSFITDGDSDWKFMDNYNRAITSMNVTNNRCATFALDYLGGLPLPTNPIYRPTLEQLYAASGITGSDNGIIGEFFKTNEEIYLGNIYGGNSYESKKRTDYIEIGEYKDLIDATPLNLKNSINNIDSPGDTYVQNFRFLRIIREDTPIGAVNVKEYEEIVEYPTETTVNLKNRSDSSSNNWDSSFVYLDDVYHKYNRVYSQQSDLIIRKNTNFNFKKVNKFDTNVIVSKVKVNNEIIDSWTDLLLNEVMTLDGKYGSINGLHNFKDELFVLQDSATAFVSILPRVQVQSSDGIGIELGEGNVLQRYKYVSIEQGSKNKWSIVNSPTAFYFYDIFNNCIQICTGQEIAKVSDLKGLHTFLTNNVDKNSILQNNPILLNGVNSTYDYINNEVFFTFLQTNKPSFTVSYNDLTQSYVSFYDYIPTRYISKGNNLLALKNDNYNLYKQYAGEYNKFFDVYYPSYVTLNVNPESNLDCVFDNINFKSDVTLNGVDQPEKTLTHIQAYNDYQDSGLIQIIVGRNENARRKFRDWNILIPRQNRNRIRAPYIKLKLQFQNEDNYKLIFHNPNIYYTV